MKLSKLFFVLVMFLLAANGFCGGKKDKGSDSTAAQNNIEQAEEPRAVTPLPRIEQPQDNPGVIQSNPAPIEVNKPDDESQLIADSSIHDEENIPVFIAEEQSGASELQTADSTSVQDNTIAAEASNTSKSNAIRIEEFGQLRTENISAIVDYMVSVAKPANIRTFRTQATDIIWEYFKEADKYGINQDLAIAQMLYTTNFFRSGERINIHNYAGFTTESEWARQLRSPSQGVRAHIQHLKGYASKTLRFGEDIVDPRWEVLDERGIRGTVFTLEDLSKRWAPNNAESYENSITNIINELRGLR